MGRKSRKTLSFPSRFISGVLLTYISGYIRLGIGETSKKHAVRYGGS